MLAELPRADRPALNGTLFTLEFDGALWQVEVQDVAGLVNIYTAPPALLRAVLPNSEAVERMRAEWAQTGRHYAPLEMTLAQLGVTPEAAAVLTQFGAATKLREENSMAVLRARLGELPPTQVMSGQVQDARLGSYKYLRKSYWFLDKTAYLKKSVPETALTRITNRAYKCTHMPPSINIPPCDIILQVCNPIKMEAQNIIKAVQKTRPTSKRPAARSGASVSNDIATDTKEKSVNIDIISTGIQLPVPCSKRHLTTL